MATKAKPDYAVNLTRSVLGQGLGMGWGDEAEAWLRSKLGNEGYEAALRKIRSEYGEFSKEYPVSQTLGEFAGGAAPGVAAMMIPGGQAAGAQQLGRSTLATLARLGAIGATTGAVAGAGSAEEGSRLPGAGVGAVLGGVTGAGAPIALKGAGAGARWLRERLAPTEGYVQKVATGKLAKAVEDSGMTPQQVEQAVAADRAMKVPSKLANVSPATVELTRAVAQRTGRGATKVEEELLKQKHGSRERVYQQTRRTLQPGDYYADEEQMVSGLRNKASTLYDQAYQHGTVDDPRILEVLKDPTFANFFNKAKAISEKEALAARLEGRDPSAYKLKDIYEPIYANDPQTGLPVLKGFNLREAPDVRTLDYIKRGIDATIDSGFRGEGMSTAEAKALRDLRKQFVTAIDENVPDYAKARKAYAGDIEVIDALRSGYKDFNKLDHEQVGKMVAGMSQAEKEAFRTGVARHIYSQVMDPSSGINAARRVIGSPEAQQKLMPLFETPSQFHLFKTALEREAQLFDQANRVLGGSQTARTQQAQQALESRTGVGEAVAGAVTGGFGKSLLNSVLRGFDSLKMTDDVAEKLSGMLMSSNPKEVAAVVKLLEEHAAQAAPKALKATAGQAGVGTGAAVSAFPAPPTEAAPQSIESAIQGDQAAPEGVNLGPSIEDVLKSEQPQ